MADLWEPINGVYTATVPLFPWLTSIPGIKFSEWGGALISAGFGAGVGAWAAGRIARGAKSRDELLAELRSADVAIGFCGAILDTAAALKRQNILVLLGQHKSDLERYAQRKAIRDSSEPFQLNINHLRLQAFVPPVADLQSLVLKGMSASPNALRSMMALVDAVENLNGMIDSYNALIGMFRDGTLPKGRQPHDYYLELCVEGETNYEYGSSLRGMALYIDDVLFFAKKLADCISSRALQLRDRYKVLSGEKVLVQRIEIFEDNLGLIPCDSAYEAWMKGWVDESDDKIKVKKFWFGRKK